MSIWKLKKRGFNLCATRLLCSLISVSLSSGDTDAADGLDENAHGWMNKRRDRSK